MFDHGERVHHDGHGSAIVEYDYGGEVCINVDGGGIVYVDRDELRSRSPF